MKPIWLLLLASACNPYNNRDGEFIAGTVDPASFPPPYVGTGGDRTKPGNGTFTEVGAYAHGSKLGIFYFAASSKQLSTGTDPLRIVDNGAPYNNVPVPKAYLFDPNPPTNPLPDQPHCTAPNNYTYDARLDDVDYSQQGTIFTAVPTGTFNPGAAATWSYIPIVAEVPVTSNAQPCQSLKSEKTLLKSTQVNVGQPDGRYVAFAIIDAAAPVYRLGQDAMSSNGVGTQKVGWYNHFDLTYLDGGYVPTEDVTASSDNHAITKMVAQNLYYPRSMIMGSSSNSAGKQGAGYDVVQFARGEDGYSPVCQVFTYDMGMPTKVSDLPKDADTIQTMFGSTIQPASTPYVYCFQVK